MGNKLVSRDNVKRYFLIADAGKKLFENRCKTFKLEEEYKNILDEIFGLSEEELNKRITNKVRLARYDSFDWCQGQLLLRDIGPWPKMYSLDARLTTSNVVDTARDIKRVKSGELVLFYEDKKEEEKRTNAFNKFLKKSRSIMTNLDFVYERFPIIIFPGGEIREKDYNTWAKENNAPLCKIFEYDLDDDNNRAVSYALKGITQVSCFYGKNSK